MPLLVALQSQLKGTQVTSEIAAGVRPEQFGDFVLTQIPKVLGNFTLQFVDNEDKSVLSLRTQMWIVSSGSNHIRLENRGDATAFRILIETHRESQRTTVTFTVSRARVRGLTFALKTPL